METIKLSEFDWIKSNSDLFKKHLYASRYNKKKLKEITY